MKDIEYTAPGTLEAAVSLLGSLGPRARVLAGGTDLIVQLREGTLARRLSGAEPDTIVDVKGIPELEELSYDPSGGLVIGAAVRCSRIHEDERIAKHYPCIVDAASLIGSIQIQNRASFGGNLCNASPAADGIAPLIALRAVCRIAGPGGFRNVSVEEFCTGPGRSVLEPKEILVSFHLPPPRPRSGAHYLRFIPRGEMDIAVAGAASYLELGNDLETIRDARIALAAVAPTPLLANDAAAALIGKPARAETFQAAADAASRMARPITDMRGTEAQRKHLAGVLVRRTLETALARAKGDRES